MRVSFRQHEEKDFVDISTGHDGKDVVSRPATDVDRARWPEEYAAYAGTAASAVEVPPTATAKPAAKPKGKG